MMEIAFSHITAKKFNINFFLTLVTGCRNHACCMADQIASKRQRRNQSCFGSVYFFVCLLNSFERVPAPGVTEIPYLANESNVGMTMLRSEFSRSIYMSIYGRVHMVLNSDLSIAIPTFDCSASTIFQSR